MVQGGIVVMQRADNIVEEVLDQTRARKQPKAAIQLDGLLICHQCNLSMVNW
jgi:hypothetical protein